MIGGLSAEKLQRFTAFLSEKHEQHLLAFRLKAKAQLSCIALLAFHLKLIIFPVKLRVDRNTISRIGKLSRASRLVGDTILGD